MRLLLTSLTAAAVFTIGSVSADTPKPTVSDLLASCPIADEPHFSPACASPIDIYSLAVMLASMRDKGMTICLPKDPGFMVRSRGEIIHWLRAHPELLDKPEDVGLDAAETTLYPCH